MAPPTRQTLSNRGATRASARCADEPAYPFDELIGRVVRLGYMAVSALSGDPLPSGLFHTFLAEEREPFDGVFLLRTDQVERIIANSEALAARVHLQRRWLVLTFTRALAQQRTQAFKPKMDAWARNIVDRLRQRAEGTGAVAYEDITTQDFSEIVEPTKRGEWIQLAPEESFPAYISFGQIGVYFSGRATFIPAANGVPPLMQLDVRPALFDDFDFHFRSEDPGTGWIDHALARLQCSGFAKPFRIEGSGAALKLVIHGAVAR